MICYFIIAACLFVTALSQAQCSSLTNTACLNQTVCGLSVAMRCVNTTEERNCSNIIPFTCHSPSCAVVAMNTTSGLALKCTVRCSSLNSTTCGTAMHCSYDQVARSCNETVLPVPCSTFLTRQTCSSNAANCMWLPSTAKCYATCALRTNPQCNSMCAISTSTVPFPTCGSLSCSITPITDCVANPQCWRNETKCTVLCETITDLGVCTSNAHCQVSFSTSAPTCVTRQNPCSWYTLPNSCGNTTHCMWNQSRCSARPCSGYNEATCAWNYRCQLSNLQCIVASCSIFGTNMAECWPPCTFQTTCHDPVTYPSTQVTTTPETPAFTQGTSHLSTATGTTTPATTQVATSFQYTTETPRFSCATLSATQCLGDCAVDPATGQCVQRPCQWFTFSACPGRCALDQLRAMCVPKRCPTDYVSCAASSACSWNATTLQCMTKGCPALWSEFSCLQDGACYWSHSSVSCISVPCSAYNGLPFDACPADRCSAAVSEVGTTSCNIKPCSAFLQDMCPKAYCVVTNSQCQQPPCASYTNSTTCAKSNCWWTLASTCAPIPCIKYLDDRTCTQNKCVFGADRVCTEPSCTTFTSSQFCASTLQCVWATSTMTLPDRCAPKPCEERFRELCSGVCIWNYTSTRCQKFWCSHFITAASCPPNQCQWDMGACAQSDCFATTTEAACASPCVFATRCVDPVIFRAPCYMINDTTRCGLQQPAGRCSWSAGVCIESFNQNTTTVVQPCYRYAAGSVCPNYCQALYGFCINPQCTKVIGNNVTCFNQGCRWNEVSRTCIDPNELNFPCHAYSSVTSCPARCKWNSTHCKGYETPSAPTQLSCGEYIDEEMCNATLRCWFTVSANGGSCTTRPCVGFSVSSCPLDRCRVPVSSCVAPCPSNLPHYCTNLGVCAASSDQCRSCSSTQVQCWDATCVTNMIDCKCPVATPHKCPSTGRCTANSSMCVTSCSSPTPVLCWNNVCAEAADNCPCPLERPTRCPGSSICVATASACATICPSFAPVRCWDGNCAANNQSCACDPQRPFRCRTNLRCYSSPLECPCPETSTPFRCNATFCSTTESDCGRNTCPTSTVQCQDGSCAASSALCCKDAQFVIPTISILGFDTTFDVTNWLRLMANATYVVCGQRQYLNITWKVYNRDTGAVWTGAGQLGQFTGVELAIPPNSIAHDTTYAVGVQTRAMNGVVASTSILISGYRPLPKLFIAGGNQVANSDVLNVAVDVQDRSWATADTNSFAWSCCSGRDCLEDCPSPVGTSLSTAQTKYVKIVGPIRAANYTVTVFFKGGNTTSTFWVRSLPTPLVQILNGATEVFAGDALPLYAIVQFSSPVVFSWFVNDTLLPLQNNRTITIPAAKLPAMYSTKITARASFGDRVGESSVIVRPSTKPWGSCSIEQVDGGVQSVSLQSQLQITGSWSGATTTLLHSFGFVDVDDRNNRRVVDITSFPQRLPSFTFTAPALVGTLASKNVEFFAKVWTDSRRVVGHVTCSHIILRSTTAAVTAIAEQRTTLEGSRRTNDTIGALTALSNLAVVTSSDANVSTTERTAVGTDVVQQLEETMQQVGSTLSASQRTSVLQTLEQVVTTTDRSSATRILNQSVRQVLEVVRRVVETAATQLSVDVDAQAALNVLSQLPIPNRTTGKDVTEVIEILSRRVARNIQLGERQIVASTNVTLEAQRRSVLDLANRTVGEKAVLKFPTSFVLPNVNETSVADLSAAQYVKDPYHGAGAPLNSVLSSTVSEFSLSVDGSDYPVRNASPPLTLRFAVNRTRVTPNTAFHCMYYDKEANQWVKTGVTFLRYDPVNGEVECSTVHLSTFGVFDNNTESTATTAGTAAASTPLATSGIATSGLVTTAAVTGTTTSPAAAPTTAADHSGAIIGGIVGGVLLACVIVGMVCLMMNRAQRRKAEEESQSPLFELHEHLQPNREDDL